MSRKPLVIVGAGGHGRETALAFLWRIVNGTKPGVAS